VVVGDPVSTVVEIDVGYPVEVLVEYDALYVV
jgi:hypothetical protein